MTMSLSRQARRLNTAREMRTYAAEHVSVSVSQHIVHLVLPHRCGTGMDAESIKCRLVRHLFS